MRLILIITVIAAALYAGYWAIGARTLNTTVSDAIVDLKRDGWVADTTFRTRGFPSRFDTTFSDVTLVSPDQSIGWTAPFLQVFALSYAPNKGIVVWPNSQRLSLAGQDIDITSEDLRASGSVGVSTRLPLDKITLVGQMVTARSSVDWSLEMQELRLATERVAPTGDQHRAGLDVSDLILPADVRRRLGAGTMPPEITNLHADITVTLDQPLDRLANAPRPTALRLSDLSMMWGTVNAAISGDLSVDASGNPQGTLTLRATGWEQLVDMAIASGAVDPGMAPMARSLLGSLAAQSEPADRLEAPITFRGGRMFFGPLPLGPAPKLF